MARSRPPGVVFCCFLLAALLPPAGVRALDCDAATQQIELNACAEMAWQEADAELNAAYQRARAAVDGATKGTLRDAQRAWIGYRDLSCEVEGAAYAGGSIQPMVVMDCLARLTWQRAEDLDMLASE